MEIGGVGQGIGLLRGAESCRHEPTTRDSLASVERLSPCPPACGDFVEQVIEFES